MTDLPAAAAWLMRAHDDGAAFTSMRGDFPFTQLATAYDIQDRFTTLLADRRGTSRLGYKIGLTSVRMQQMCAIPHPIAGPVLADRVLPSRAGLKLSHFGRLGLEFEIAVRIGQDIPADHMPETIEVMAEHVGAVAPAFEVIDDRRADYAALDMLTLVADTSWNAGAVVGDFHDRWDDLAGIAGVVRVNGAEIDRGHGRDVLGHPFQPLIWLQRHLAARGAGLRAGDVVLTGSLVPTRFPTAGQTFSFDLAGLGMVEVSVSA